jgi:hypothetical protein
MIRCLSRGVAIALLLWAAASARAEATLTHGWTDISCGVIGANGMRTEQPCDGRSFSALVMNRSTPSTAPAAR